MKKLKQLLRDVRIALGKLILDSNKAVLDTAKLQPIKSILFLRQDGKIGDYIVSSFVFRELKKQNPNIKIGVVCSDKSLFEKNPNIDILYPVRKKNILDYIKTGIQLRRERYDVLIDPTVFLRNRDLLLIRLINAKVNIGYLKADYQMFNLSIDNQQLHFAEVYQTALEALGFHSLDLTYDVPQDKQSAVEITEFLQQHGLENYIAINFFGAPRSRRFNEENIRLMLQDLRSKITDKPFVLLTYPAVTELLKKVSSMDKNIYLYENTKNIFQSIELIRAADLVISPDTSIVHIASGLNKKMIVFYHQHDLGLANWGPRSNNTVYLLCYQQNINEIEPSRIQKEWLS